MKTGTKIPTKENPKASIEAMAYTALIPFLFRQNIFIYDLRVFNFFSAHDGSRCYPVNSWN
jgi:hypothetical protein